MVVHTSIRRFRRSGIGVAAATFGALALFAAACTPPGASTQVTQVGAGSAHTCAVMTDGRVTCWGLNIDGQVGNGVFTGGVAVPLTVVGVSGARQVVGGQEHTCALVAGGKVKCWGSNGLHQLGNASNLDSPTPVVATVVSGAVQLTATIYSTCALLDTTGVKCWGGVSGDPSGLTGVTQVSGTCALLADRTVRCWGDNNFGQIGDGTTTPRPTPVPVAGLTDVIQIAGTGDNYCALLGDGTARCWGFGRQGQMGNGTNDDVNPLPVAVTGLVGASQLSASSGHTCAIVAGGAVRCWGANSSGALGDGTTTDRSVPVAAIGLSGVRQVEAGGAFTCAVLASRSLTCWGENVHGQLGTVLGSTTTPGALVKF